MPDGDQVEQIHARWSSQFAKLEKHHGYIQWLFPVFENCGMNTQAHRLTKREAGAMRSSMAVARRVVTSYRMMLSFYGFDLVDERTGALARSDDWKARFRNLNFKGHNNLRISRILVSLGELGFRRYKAPLLEALRIEIFERNNLPNCRSSFVEFWKGLVHEEGADWYARKTRESSSDRADSVFFSDAQSAPQPQPQPQPQRSGGTARAAGQMTAAAVTSPTLGRQAVKDIQLALGVLRVGVLRSAYKKLLSEGHDPMDSAAVARMQQGLVRVLKDEQESALASSSFLPKLLRRLEDGPASNGSGRRPVSLAAFITALSVFASGETAFNRMDFAFSLFATDERLRGTGGDDQDDRQSQTDRRGLDDFLQAWFGGGCWIADEVVAAHVPLDWGAAASDALSTHGRACSSAALERAAGTLMESSGASTISLNHILTQTRQAQADDAPLAPLRLWLRLVNQSCRHPKLPHAELLPAWAEARQAGPAATEFRADRGLNGRIRLWCGDITKLEVDAVVNAANAQLRNGGGICGAIHDAAGQQLGEECRRIGSCRTGDTVITNGYSLPATWVLHTVGPTTEDVAALRSCYTTILDTCKARQIKSVALCCVSTGIYGFPAKKAAHTAL